MLNKNIKSKCFLSQNSESIEWNKVIEEALGRLNG
jgi:hypothetical protein